MYKYNPQGYTSLQIHLFGSTESFSFPYDSQLDGLTQPGEIVCFQSQPYYILCRAQFELPQSDEQIKVVILDKPEGHKESLKRKFHLVRDLDAILFP